MGRQLLHGFFQYVVFLRDAAVDDMIVAQVRSNDPLSGAAEIEVPIRSRSKLFEKANVPEVIKVKSPEITTADGTRVPEFSLEATSTPRRTCNVTAKFSTEFIE